MPYSVTIKVPILQQLASEESHSQPESCQPWLAGVQLCSLSAKKLADNFSYRVEHILCCCFHPSVNLCCPPRLPNTVTEILLDSSDMCFSCHMLQLPRRCTLGQVSGVFCRNVGNQSKEEGGGISFPWDEIPNAIRCFAAIRLWRLLLTWSCVLKKYNFNKNTARLIASLHPQTVPQHFFTRKCLPDWLP